MNEANNWQVFAICLILLGVAYGIARMAAARRTERLAATLSEPPHVESARRMLADAQSKHLDLKTSGDHALVLAAMYEGRIKYLRQYLADAGAAPPVSADVTVTNMEARTS